MAGLGLRSGNAATLSTMVLAESIRRQGKYLGGLAGRRRLEGEATRSVVFRHLIAERGTGFQGFPSEDAGHGAALGFVRSRFKGHKHRCRPRAEGRGQVPGETGSGCPQIPTGRGTLAGTGSRTRFSRTRGERTPPSCAHCTLHFKGAPAFSGTQLHSRRSRMESGLEALSSSPRGTSGFFCPFFLISFSFKEAL